MIMTAAKEQLLIKALEAEGFKCHFDIGSVSMIVRFDIPGTKLRNQYHVSEYMIRTVSVMDLLEFMKTTRERTINSLTVLTLIEQTLRVHGEY